MSGALPAGEGLPFAGTLWLAPLTRGGHLAFRRLCLEQGAQVTVGEMAVARRLLRGDSREFALLKSHADEPCFGVQLAGNSPARGLVHMLAEIVRWVLIVALALGALWLLLQGQA